MGKTLDMAGGEYLIYRQRTKCIGGKMSVAKTSHKYALGSDRKISQGVCYGLYSAVAAWTEVLKKQRLERAGVSKTVKLTDSDKKPYLLNANDRRSGRYRVQSACKRVHNYVTYTDIHSKKTLGAYNWTDLIILRTIDVVDGITPEPDDIYNCPNCGAAVKLGIFDKEGCPFCKTRVDMSNLYPMVTNAFFAHDYKNLKDKDIYSDSILVGPLVSAFPGLLIGLGAGAAALDEGAYIAFLPIVFICTGLAALFGVLVSLFFILL